MQNFNKILSLLKQKKEYYFEIEALTEKMKEEPVPKLQSIFEKRGGLLLKVSELDTELFELIDGNAEAIAVLKNSISPDNMGAEDALLYKLSFDVKAIANRVLRADKEIRRRIENERDALIKLLEKTNTIDSKAIAGYKRSVQTGVIHPAPKQSKKGVKL